MSSTILSNINHSKKLFSKNPLNNLLNNSIRYTCPSKYNKSSYEIDTESFSAIKGFQISNSSFSAKENKNIILHMKILAKEKMSKKYNCTKDKYNSYIINNILRNDYCHIVALFKDILLNYSNLEFITNFYKMYKYRSLISELYSFYKNYFYFYCKPIFNQISLNIMLKNYYENQAKCFLKIDFNENSKNSENKSDNDTNSIDNKTIETLSQSQHIFNHYVKEFLEEKTDLTNANDADEEQSKEETMNLNMDNEKLEIFKENKKDYSNNSTFADIVNYMSIKKTNNNNNINKQDKNILKKSILVKNKNKMKDNNKINNSKAELCIKKNRRHALNVGSQDY